ncbi:melanopsin-like [Dendronephthya gigantea]|uniref:melanopsin-like n=1 Tax=Dendronephthya gigantea TaxID=151771 RepID=UPI00106A7E0E|nr:melanopsin-like [Dendronephthya gigantea]XP_028397557.1 melanopsin-like [Dendronephthya gigantea]
MNNTTVQSNPFEFPSQISILVIAFLGVIANGILLVVLLWDPLKCFRRPSMYFVISLAFSDFFTGIASCLFAVKDHVTSEYFGLILQSAIFCSIENSFITILLMSIERLIVIMFPMKAISIITSRRIFISIGVTWFFSILLGAAVSFPPGAIFNDYVKFGILIECFLIILIMLGIYIRMIFLLKNSSNVFRENGFIRHSSCDARSRRSIDRYHRSLNTVVFYLALVLIITVLPHLILGQVYLGYKFFHPNHPMPLSLQYAPYVTFPIELLNFVLNSVIYAYRLPQFRASLFHCCKKKSGNQRQETALRRILFHNNVPNGNHTVDDDV